MEHTFLRPRRRADGYKVSKCLFFNRSVPHWEKTLLFRSNEHRRENTVTPPEPLSATVRWRWWLSISPPHSSHFQTISFTFSTASRWWEQKVNDPPGRLPSHFLSHASLSLPSYTLCTSGFLSLTLRLGCFYHPRVSPRLISQDGPSEMTKPRPSRGESTTRTGPGGRSQRRAVLRHLCGWERDWEMSLYTSPCILTLDIINSTS